MKIQLLVIAAMLMLLFNNCGDIRLSAKPVGILSQPSMGEFCVAEPQTRARYTKFMFVIDKSGSNMTTDPGANKRSGSIERFHQANQDNQYMKWGMITFQDPGTKAVIGAAQDPIFVDGDNPLVSQAIVGLRTGDVGGTPYGAALALTQRAIEKDLLESSGEDNTYMIFFVSDGQPTDGSNEPALRSSIRNIINLHPGKVFLSTGFYSANGSGGGVAISLLTAMAQEGFGKFINFQNTNDFDFNDLIVEGPTKEPWQIKNSMLMVYNVSSAICENNTFDTDSDSDGVCDQDEHAYTVNGQTLNLDPTKRYSQPTLFPHYSDYFVLRHIKYGETLNPCNDPNADFDVDHDLLNTCEERYIYNANPRGVLDHTGNPKNPDTDLDGFIDGIETLVFRTSLGYAMNSFNMMDTFDFESVSAAIQVRQHRNPMAYDPNAFAYDTMVLPTGTNALGQSCYSFSQNNLLLHPTKAVQAQNILPELQHGADENVIMIYYIQTPQRDPDSKGVLMYSFQKLLRSPARINGYGTAAGLKLNQFKSYIVP